MSMLIKKILYYRIRNNSMIFYLIIISILIMPIKLLSLTTVIKYKGDKSQSLTNCGSSDACSPPPSYDSYYTKNIKEETEYINNQLVYIAELQWKNSINSFKCLFSECYNIISIDLSNFDASICNDMTAMFRGCSSLISVNLTNFVVSKATNLGQMFFGCSSLTSLDLSSFIGTNVQNMTCMLKDCSSLVDLNFKNFDFKNVNEMRSLFSGCTSLVSLNLHNFNTPNAQYMDKLFCNCTNLKYINIPNVITSSNTITTDM